ncbi:hypothetical protein L596_011685 [Steinernema carpocapsae]|uniref:SAM domain-containing protein n=1 Tax=Steinernema carpocapsae TaxID=34508 RepID=A0A4U5NUQ1_STECR|nr:hypothetical protein L596_011685 [Steinernema carpocapsae]
MFAEAEPYIEPLMSIDEAMIGVVNNPATWSREELRDFLRTTVLAPLTDVLYEEEIDGQSFVMLTANDYVNILQMKLGFALHLHQMARQLVARYLEHDEDALVDRRRPPRLLAYEPPRPPPAEVEDPELEQPREPRPVRYGSENLPNFIDYADGVGAFYVDGEVVERDPEDVEQEPLEEEWDEDFWLNEFAQNGLHNGFHNGLLNYMDGPIENGHLPNGFAQNGFGNHGGHLVNGHVENGFVENGLVENGFIEPEHNALNGFVENGAFANGHLQNGLRENGIQEEDEVLQNGIVENGFHDDEEDDELIQNGFDDDGFQDNGIG